MFSAEHVITRNILERQAQAFPHEVFVTFEDGSCWTRQEGLEAGYAAANTLREAGVRQGDRVCVLYANGPEFLRAWWGISALGAIMVPIHTGYRGAILEHLLRLSQPVAVVGDPNLMHVLDDLPERSLVPSIRLKGTELCSANRTPPSLERPIETWDAQAYLLTSGTTGPSKLAVISYRNMYAGGVGSIIAPLRGREDLLLIDPPLFHGAAFRAAFACLSMGVRMAVRSAPRLSSYWEVLKETEATMSFLISSMVDVLLAQAPRPAEREHDKLRIMLSTPLPRDVKGFMERFAIPRMHALYGSTELPGVLRVDPDDELVHGYCGRVQPGYHCKIVDENDIEVPHGQPGELLARHDEPWVITSEYVNNSAATATAWRNGWFHTGDMMRQEADGRFFFIDRVKDSLRRRGENISSSEVEAEILAYPGVKEAACVPCRLPEAIEDEVKVWIIPKFGQTIDFESLLRFCVERMPHFMVPRFFELTDTLPLTPSEKVRKIELRERGNGPHTWDREARGFRVTRDGLKEI